MDFAEDYHCQNNDEVQNAYFGAGNVAIFPAVVYYRDAESAELLVKSTAFISDEGSHDSYAVHAILDKLLPTVKQFVPDLKEVFYWTDSPTSQFRNKTIFHIISEHKEEYNCVASWNYFEAGHGKGPCDGVGGTVKRLADDYVKQNKVVIQDAADFFAWGRDKQSESKIDYTFVSTDEYKLSKVSLQSRFEVIKPVQGTMKVHAAVGWATTV